MTENTTRAARPIPLALTALVALFSALVALAFSGGMDMAQAHGNAPHPAKHSRPALTPKAVALQMEMRKLWEDHITWTRTAIIGLEDGTPDANASVARLLRNQVDIGNAVKPFYGKAAGDALTGLLRDHILIAADVSRPPRPATKRSSRTRRPAGSTTPTRSRPRSTASTRAWKLREMKAEMHRHLDLTTQEAVARLQHDWTGDVAAYDRVHLHILHMADMLSAGIIAQFPGRFR